MRYLYNGVIVESDRTLDSTIFTPVNDTPVEKPTNTPVKPQAKKVTNKSAKKA